jgi:hypothetical protein
MSEQNESTENNTFSVELIEDESLEQDSQELSQEEEEEIPKNRKERRKELARQKKELKKKKQFAFKERQKKTIAKPSKFDGISKNSSLLIKIAKSAASKKFKNFTKNLDSRTEEKVEEEVTGLSNEEPKEIVVEKPNEKLTKNKVQMVKKNKRK